MRPDISEVVFGVDFAFMCGSGRFGGFSEIQGV